MIMGTDGKVEDLERSSMEATTSGKRAHRSASLGVLDGAKAAPLPDRLPHLEALGGHPAASIDAVAA
jgi:hypothetical protein